MASLTVWKFDDPYGAEDALARLQQLQRENLIQIVDAAQVTWEEGKKKPKTRQLHNLTGAGALGGAFWGMLFGLIFLVPLLGAAIGAAAGGIGGALSDVGIDDDFIAGVRREVTPGTSALFLMSQDAVVDRVQEAFEGTKMTLIRSNLSSEQEERLREAFEDTDVFAHA